MPNNAKIQIAELKKLNLETVNETKASISFFEDAISKTNVYISNFTDLKQSFLNNTISLNKMNNNINELLISIKNYIDSPTRENLNLFQDKKNIIISSNRETSTNLKLTYNNLSIIKNNIFEKKTSFEKSIELLKNLKIKNNKFKLLMLKIKQFIKLKRKRKSIDIKKIDLKKINISNLKESNKINNNSKQSTRKIFTALAATADPRCAGWREILALIGPVIVALEKKNKDIAKDILEKTKEKDKEEADQKETFKKLEKEKIELKRLNERVKEYNTVIVKHMEFIEENIKEINENNAILNSVYSFNSNNKTENLNNPNKLYGIMNTTMHYIKTVDNLSNLISIKEIPDQIVFNKINKLKPNIKNYQSEFNSIKNLIKKSGLVKPKTQNVIIKEFKNNLSLFDNTSSNIKNISLNFKNNNYGKYINNKDGEYINEFFRDFDELERIKEVCEKLLENIKKHKDNLKKLNEDLGKVLDEQIETLTELNKSITIYNSTVKNIADNCP